MNCGGERVSTGVVMPPKCGATALRLKDEQTGKRFRLVRDARVTPVLGTCAGDRLPSPFTWRLEVRRVSRVRRSR